MAYHFSLQDDSGKYLFQDLNHNLMRGDSLVIGFIYYPSHVLISSL